MSKLKVFAALVLALAVAGVGLRCCAAEVDRAGTTPRLISCTLGTTSPSTVETPRDGPTRSRRTVSSEATPKVGRPWSNLPRTFTRAKVVPPATGTPILWSHRPLKGPTAPATCCCGTPAAAQRRSSFRRFTGTSSSGRLTGGASSRAPRKWTDQRQAGSSPQDPATQPTTSSRSMKATVSERSAKTALAPFARSTCSSNPPVATATERAPRASGALNVKGACRRRQ